MKTTRKEIVSYLDTLSRMGYGNATSKQCWFLSGLLYDRQKDNQSAAAIVQHFDVTGKTHHSGLTKKAASLMIDNCLNS